MFNRIGSSTLVAVTLAVALTGVALAGSITVHLVPVDTSDASGYTDLAVDVPAWVAAGYVVYDLVVVVEGPPDDESWLAAGAYADLTDGTFWEHPEGGDIPEPALFPVFGLLRFDSFWTCPEDWPNPDLDPYTNATWFPGGGPLQKTATERDAEWFGDYSFLEGPGTYTIARYCFLPSSDTWGLRVNGIVLLDSTGGQPYPFAVCGPAVASTCCLTDGSCDVLPLDECWAVGGIWYGESCGCDGNPCQPPVADAGGPYSGVVGEPITFDASGSYDDNGTIVAYRWDWTMDGTWDDEVTTPITTHTYEAEFYSEVRLEVEDNDGNTDHGGAYVGVGPRPPVAEAGGPYSAEVDEPITFDASGSYHTDPNGIIASYRWDWTNNGTWDTDWLDFISNPMTQHTYTAPFQGEAKLEVQDNDGLTDTDTAQVDVVSYTPDFVVTAPGTWSGNTCGAGNDCGWFTEEVIYEVYLPTAGIWTFDLCESGYDTLLFIGYSGCADDVLVQDNSDECGAYADQSYAQLYLPAGTYYVTLEGNNGACGSYTLAISFAEGAEGDTCGDPIAVTLGFDDLPYVTSNTTCGRYNSYADTCLGYYDGGDDIIYELTFTEDLDLGISVDGSSRVGVALDTACPPGATCLAYATASGGDPSMTVSVTAGTYYLMVDTWPSPQCTDFTLTIGGPPEGAEGDTCADPIAVTLGLDDLPYVTSDTTCGRYNSYADTCLGYYDGGEDIIYELTFTEDLDLGISVVGSSWVGVALDTVCPPGATCLAYATASGGNPSMTVSVTAGTYYLMIDTWPSPQCTDFTLTIGGPCQVTCPPGASLEGESDCEENWEDNYNGGCNWSPFVFSTITCGETVCGTAGTYLYYGANYFDTDWYEIEITEETQLIWTAQAEFPVRIIIVDAGSGNCVDYTILGYAQGNPCDDVTLSEVVAAGTYWLWVGPSVSEGVPCTGVGSNYVATVACEPWVLPTGACCVNGVCVATNTQAECNALAGAWYANEDCATFNCPPGCTHTVTLYDSYGDGWNGNTLDVYVNGLLVLDEITLDSGFGPVSYYFLAETGDEIHTVYQPIGGWPEEPYYQIYDGLGQMIVQDGGNYVQPTGVTVYGNCPANQPPVAEAGGPYSGVVGAPITFDASDSYDPDGTIVGYRWDWTNDGSWDTPWLPALYWTRSYDAEYHGLATLQVQDNEGTLAQDTTQVDAYPVTGDNDDCEDSIPVGEGSIPFSTIGATTDGPAHPGDCQYDGQMAYDIWYHLSSPSDFLTITVAADFDCDLAIYELPCVYPCEGCDCAEASLVNCNDDAYWLGDPHVSQAAVYLRSDRCYKIRIGSRDASVGTGTGVLTIERYAFDRDVFEELLAAELRSLGHSVRSTMDQQVEHATDKYGQVVVALRLTGGDWFLLGCNVFGAICSVGAQAVTEGIVEGSTALYLLEHGMEDTSIAIELGRLIENQTALFVAMSVTDMLLDFGRIADVLSSWPEANQSLLETDNEWQISAALLGAFKDIPAWGESHDLTYEQFQDELTTGIYSLADLVVSGLPIDYPVFAVIRRLDDLRHSVRTSVAQETWIVPIREPLAPAPLGSPVVQYNAVDELLGQLDVSDWVGAGTAIFGVGLAVGKFAAAWWSFGVGALVLDIAAFGVGAVGAVNTVAVGIPTKAALTDTATLGLEAAELDCHTLGSIALWATEYLSDFDALSDILPEPQVSWTMSIPNQELAADETFAEFHGAIEALNYGDDPVFVVAVAIVVRSEPGIPLISAMPVAIIANDPVLLIPQQQVVFELSGSTIIASDPQNTYFAWVYLYAGPSVAPYLADPMAREQVFTITRNGKNRPSERGWVGLGSGSLSEGEAAEYTYDPSVELWSTDLVLFHTSGNLDLHVYDDQRRHVGRNYATGATECEIPGAEYSGAYMPMETVRLPSPAGQYDVRVVAFQASNRESFSVGALEVPVSPAVLSVAPPVLNVARDITDTATWAFDVYAREISGQSDYVGLSAGSSDLVAQGAVIPSENVIFDVPSSTVPAGGCVPVGVTVNIPSGLPSDTYTGTFAFGLEPVEVLVALELGYAPTRPATPLGRTSGFADLPYVYRTHATDPEGESLYYRFCWGEETETEWLGPFDSGETCIGSHAWSRAGTYGVRVIARDERGWCSLPSELLVVTILEPDDQPKYPQAQPIPAQTPQPGPQPQTPVGRNDAGGG